MTGSAIHYCISEWGELSTDPGRTGALTVDRDFPFAQLREVRAVDRNDEGKKSLKPFRWVDHQTLAGRGRVGVVAVDGTSVELLPKTWSTGTDPSEGRLVLSAMLDSYVEEGRLARPHARRLNAARVGAVNTREPVAERILRNFTQEVEALLQAGVRFSYPPVSEERPYLRGRLDLGRQVRQPPGRDHLFHIRHTRFHADRPENRLLRAGLFLVAARSADADLRTHAAQLAEVMADVPASRSVSRDLEQWDNGRLLAHYAGVRPWCRLVLEPLVGLTAGERFGEAWLWRTDQMFERHLEVRLRSRIAMGSSDLQLELQGGGASARHLGRDAAGGNVFKLMPDVVLHRHGQFLAVLDAKWKTQKEAAANEIETLARTPVSREDAYQMYAYGNRYLQGVGPVVLVYPSTADFQEPVLHTLGELTLVALPLDVAADRFLIGTDERVRRALGEELTQLLAQEPEDVWRPAQSGAPQA